MSGALSLTMPVEAAERDLKHLLDQLDVGETITLTTAHGDPLAVLVSIKKPTVSHSVANWDMRWDTLAHKVSQAWQSEKSALEILTEMRR